jgi:hypothetical protein
MRFVLKFVGERYATACMNPLQQGIIVPTFPLISKLATPETDPAVAERATRLWTEVQETSQLSEGSLAAAEGNGGSV